MIGLIFNEQTLLVMSENSKEISKLRQTVENRLLEKEKSQYLLSKELDIEVFFSLKPANKNAFLVRGLLAPAVVEGILLANRNPVIDVRNISFCGSCSVDHQAKTCPHRPELDISDCFVGDWSNCQPQR